MVYNHVVEEGKDFHKIRLQGIAFNLFVKDYKGVGGEDLSDYHYL